LTGSGQEAKVTASLDTNAMLIGDQIKLNLSFTGPAASLIQWPALPDTIMNNIQVIRRSVIDTVFSADKKEITLKQAFTLTSFDTGVYSIPQIPVYYQVPPDTTEIRAAGAMLFLRVETVPVDTTKAIKPIKGPMKVPLTFKEILPWILLGLAAAAVIAGIIWYVRRRRKNEPIIELKPKVVVLPHERALRALEELRQKKLWQSGMVKEYYTELTDILRTYIEDAFHVPAMESVTDEIIDGLEGKGSIERKDIRDLQGILVSADLVKFAKAHPLPDENGTAFDNSIRFVQNTSTNRKDAEAQ
jgi:hypothetical protein